MRRIFTLPVLWSVIIVQSMAIAGLVATRTPSTAGSTSVEKEASPERRARPRSERVREAAPPPPKGRRYFAAPSDPEWVKTASTLDPDKARQLLADNNRDITDVEQRAEKAWHIISQLCRNGYTRDAWNLIEATDGSVRQKSIGGFFRDANLPDDELVGMLDALKTADRSSGLYNYWSRFSPEEFAALDMKRFPLKSGFENGAFERIIGELLTDCFHPENPGAGSSARAGVLTSLVEQTNAGMVSYWQVANLIKKDPARDGFLY